VSFRLVGVLNIYMWGMVELKVLMSGEVFNGLTACWNLRMVRCVVWYYPVILVLLTVGLGFGVNVVSTFRGLWVIRLLDM